MFELSFPFLMRGQVAGAPKIRPAKNRAWQVAGFTFDIQIPEATLGVMLIRQRPRRIYLSTEGNLADSIEACELMVNERLKVLVGDIDSYAYTRETPSQVKATASMLKFTIIGFQSLTRPELWDLAPGNDQYEGELLMDPDRLRSLTS